MKTVKEILTIVIGFIVVICLLILMLILMDSYQDKEYEEKLLQLPLERNQILMEIGRDRTNWTVEYENPR